MKFGSPQFFFNLQKMTKLLMNHHCNLGMIYYQPKSMVPWYGRCNKSSPPELSSVGFHRDVPPSPLPRRLIYRWYPIYDVTPSREWSCWNFHGCFGCRNFLDFQCCVQKTPKEFDPCKCFFYNQPHWHCANEERTANEGGQILPPVPLKLSTGLPCKSRSEWKVFNQPFFI